MDGGGKLAEMSREELNSRGFGPLGVDEIQHCVVRLADGCGLAMRVWAPKGSLKDLGKTDTVVIGKEGDSEGKYPTVLEYLPYRKADYTAQRDHRRHPWLASHGYVVVRADMRGSGDSDGVYYDEYLKQEQDDACELIKWITSQSWSSGKVGMYGKSWGGFNGLQVAARQPPGLATIISLYSTDDRMEEDIHWKGGCVLGGGMLSWAAVMFCWDARPPHPQYRSDWAELWRKRLETAGECLAGEWLRHQVKDSYWQHGSVGLNPEQVKIPVLAIGGWHDGYTRCALRMAQTLPKCRAIVGPWSHNWPDEAVPGPNIGFMDECLGWWDAHLKTESEISGPRVRWFQALGVERPGPWVKEWKGIWQDGEASAGSASLAFSLASHGRLLAGRNGTLDSCVTVGFSGDAGLACGEWLSFGAPDLPGDHRRVSPFQATWTSDPLEGDTYIFGEADVELELSVDRDTAQVNASLCHVFPDGASRLLTYGLLNLCSLEPGRQLKPGETYTARLAMDPVGYTVPGGHSLQLLLCPGSFPTSWPSPFPVNLTIKAGTISLPTLPKLNPDSSDSMFRHLAPRCGPKKVVEQLRSPKFDREARYGMADNRREIIVTTDDGLTYFPDVDTEIEEINVDHYTIVGDDPTSAEAVCTRSCTITYAARTDKPIKTLTQTKSVMKADTKNFLLTNTLTTKLDDVDFFCRTWKEAVHRNGV